MKGVYISTYGCQMNENDSERMYTLLEMEGYHAVPSPELADLILINSCSVREKPVHKVFSEVGTYRQLKQKKPHLKIGVGGCVGSQEKEKLLEASPLIDFVFGTDNIDLLPSILHELDHKGRIARTEFRHREPYYVETLIRNPKVTAFVNITKGCDNFCTFCVVPYTRGREKSRPLQHILEDLNRLVQRGVKEVTLLGQNVNSYRSECGADFADLLQAVARDTDVLRIRYTTSHPKDFNEKLVKVMANWGEKICEYIHLPVQSGNTQVLERMNRGYTREDYLHKVATIRKFLPHAVLSTDIIVGFPGETEAQFLDTLSLVKEVGYETLFAFKYSPRPYTKAARYPDQIPEEEKNRRLQYLLTQHEEWASQWVKKYEGQVVEVLLESYDTKRGTWYGRSRQNKNVYFVAAPEEHQVGDRVLVRVEQAFPNVFRGHPLDPKENHSQTKPAIEVRL